MLVEDGCSVIRRLYILGLVHGVDIEIMFRLGRRASPTADIEMKISAFLSLIIETSVGVGIYRLKCISHHKLDPLFYLIFQQ